MLIEIRDLIVMLVLFGANFIQAITGFAGTLIAMPPTIKLIGVTEAKALLNVIAQISCLLIVITGWKHINWKEFWKMFVIMMVGMFAGIKIFEIAPMKNLLIFYGIMIVIIALCKLFLKIKVTMPDAVSYFVILAAGMIHGMFVSGGALLVIYASAKLKDKEEFRVTMALIWVTIGCYITSQQIAEGSFNSHVIILLIGGLIPVFIGTWLGTKLVKIINQNVFEKMTYILLLLSGILAIV